jgi:HEPN domain-containing protein
MTLEEENRRIDDIFKRIRNVSQAYLDSRYPDAPDPDMAIEKIAIQLDLYNMIVR